MAERILSPSTYIIVYGTLIAITCISVGFSFLPLAHVWHVVIGAILGACKTTLVVLFFMHVLFSPRLTWIVILTTIFWLGILLVLVLSDYLSRELVPGMWGH